MLLTTGGAAVGNSAAGVLADKSPLLLLISGAFLQITVVFAYYLYDKKFDSEKCLKKEHIRNLKCRV